MSTGHPLRGRADVRHARHPKSPPHTPRAVPSRDEAGLATLPYGRGHLTEQEHRLFDELRGTLTAAETTELQQVARTLRQPRKRLRALDLVRTWGAPLSPDQRAMLPWFAGLPWHRPLPSEGPPLDPVALARHLLCGVEVPDFLLEPFAHPTRYRPSLHWDLCRLLSVVGSGDGLETLRGLDPFWSEVPEPVFHDFLRRTPAETPVLQGLIEAFVRAWGGPDWLGAQAITWTTFGTLAWDLRPVLRGVQDACRYGSTAEEALRAFLERLEGRGIRRYHRELFGVTEKAPIPGVLPDALAHWTCHELRYPDEFEAEDAVNHRGVACCFRDALRGRVSLWSLQCEGERVLLRVDLHDKRVWPLGTYRRHPRGAEGDASTRAWAIAQQWAVANGLMP